MSAFVGEGATTPGDERPLTDQEYQLLQRLLSDPFSLPLTFKSWLISYLESSDLTLPISAILGLSTLLGVTSAGGGSLGIFPAGIILPYGADAAPVGSKLCDGGGYSRTQEQRLFDAIGLRYTVGDDGASFNVPDMRGRVAVGKGSTPDHDTVGKNDNLALTQRNVKHGHSTDWTPETPMGMHNASVAAGTDFNDIPFGATMEPYVGETAEHTHGSNLTRVGVNGQTEGPAFLTINFIIIA